ncbi:hypothetical protein ACGE24_07360 [Corynebacterium kroppenstedtii]|uniref:hypothetical protein n=1 Tax=Corynebacterium sp. PCR 32 TaxID=3351342 RepID=UPI0030A1F667
MTWETIIPAISSLWKTENPRGRDPSDIITEDLIRNVYDIDCLIRDNPTTGRPMVAYR